MTEIRVVVVCSRHSKRVTVNRQVQRGRGWDIRHEHDSSPCDSELFEVRETRRVNRQTAGVEMFRLREVPSGQE